MILLGFTLAYQREDMLNGNLGFSGSNPVIQVAGAQRVIESDPRELFTSGNFATVPTMYIFTWIVGYKLFFTFINS